MLSASRLLLQGSLTSSFWLFLATLPPLQIGLWIDSESVLVFSYFLFAFMGLGLIIYSFQQPLAYSKRSLLLATTLALSCLATLWAENRPLHHWGVPMTGEGTAFWAGLSLMSLAFDQLAGARLRWIKLSACLASCVAGVLVLCNNPMYWLGWYPEWAPYMFAAFLAPMALVTALCGWLVAAIPLLILSHNKTLILAIIAACGIWFVLRQQKRSWTIATICAIPFAVLALDFLGQYMWDMKYGLTHDQVVMDHWWSLRSRALSVLVYVQSWMQEPWKLLSGYGWGSYFQHLQQHITSLPISLFYNGVWRPNWDGVDRVDFHAMHQGLEHLFSLGLAGLVLYVSLMLLPFYKTTITFRRFIVAVSFASVTSTWFTLACVWPYWILAWVLVMPQEQLISLKRTWLISTALGLGTIIVAEASWNQWKTAILYPTTEKSWLMPFTYTKSRPSAEKWNSLYNIHGFHAPYFVFNILSKKDQIPKNTLKNELSNALTIYDPHNSTLLLNLGMLHVVKYLTPQDAQYGNTWLEVVKSILRNAPKRSDMAETYIQYGLQHGHKQEVCDIINSLLQRNPEDKCALWYKGLILAQTQKNKREGVECLKKALSLGAELWIPTPQNLIKQLKAPSLG